MKSADLPLIDIVQINENIGHPHSFSNDLVIELLQTKSWLKNSAKSFWLKKLP